MSVKQITLYLLIVLTAVFISACTNVESKTQDEVVIDGSSTKSKDEVYITKSDSKDQETSVETIRNTENLDKRLLADQSYIETMIDGYGNKTESRYFKGNPRIRSVILRTKADGTQEVTVYGVGGEATIVDGFGDKALTASGDEIVSAAKISAPTSYDGKNFIKSQRTESQPLQPLPSSAFQQPIRQPVQNVPPSSDAVTAQEDED